MAGVLRTMAALKQKVGIQTRPFEFVHSLRDKECDVLFLRDRHRAYYHFGVKGVGSNIDEIAEFLNSFVSERGYDSVVTLGHSMGGYAAILFASKINADACIAISAPTFLDPENRSRYGDERYSCEKARLWESRPDSAKYFDLQSYIPSSGRIDTLKQSTYFLFYGERDRVDKIHATRMMSTGRHVHVFELKGGDHNTARIMRNSGLLSRLYGQIISPETWKDTMTILQMLKSEQSIRQILLPQQTTE